MRTRDNYPTLPCPTTYPAIPYVGFITPWVMPCCCVIVYVTHAPHPFEGEMFMLYLRLIMTVKVLSLTCAYPLSLPNTHAHTHTRTHAHMRTHAHTHARARAIPAAPAYHGRMRLLRRKRKSLLRKSRCKRCSRSVVTSRPRAPMPYVLTHANAHADTRRHTCRHTW